MGVVAAAPPGDKVFIRADLRDIKFRAQILLVQELAHLQS